MSTFAELIGRAQMHDEFWEEDIAADFTEELVRWMEMKDLSRSGLATLIGHSPSYVTKVLRGDANLTASSMAKLARAVGARVRVHLAPPQSRTVWYDIFDNDGSSDQVVTVHDGSTGAETESAADATTTAIVVR